MKTCDRCGTQLPARRGETPYWCHECVSPIVTIAVETTSPVVLLAAEHLSALREGRYLEFYDGEYEHAVKLVGVPLGHAYVRDRWFASGKSCVDECEVCGIG